MKKRIILGLDPGLATVGFAMLDLPPTPSLAGGGATHRVLDFGVITTSPDLSFPERLLHIKHDLQALIQKFQPTEAVIEELFFSTNTKTAMSVAHARGVLLVTLAEENIPLRQLTPNQIKLAVTGDGRADKRQVQDMLMRCFSLSELPKPDDAADALAIAYAGMLS